MMMWWYIEIHTYINGKNGYKMKDCAVRPIVCILMVPILMYYGQWQSKIFLKLWASEWLRLRKFT